VQDTCGFADDRKEYRGGTCSLSAEYGNGGLEGGEDAVYKVRLNGRPGLENRVGFRLESRSPGTDLVLVLVRDCEDPMSCESHSPDFIGSTGLEVEEIPPRSYEPGIYYLFVDSATTDPPGHCGRYLLKAFGVNPTPDLTASLTGPEEVVAGAELAYELKVENQGSLDATGVRSEIALPEATTLVDTGGCRRAGPHHAVCEADSLAARGAPLTRRLTLRVEPSARADLVASARVHATEGAQDISQCRGEATDPHHCAATRTRVHAETDLALHLKASSLAVAGCPSVHTFLVSNDGPSDATEVEVTEDLPPQLELVEGDLVKPRGCDAVSCLPESFTDCRRGPGGGAICGLGRLTPGATRLVCLRTTVASSAPRTLQGLAEVRSAAAEIDRDPADNEVSRTIRIERRTDLAIRKRAVPDRSVAGKGLTYQILVRNLGPSDSSGGTVCDALPPDVELESLGGCCTAADSHCLIGRCQERFPQIVPNRLVACDLGAIPPEGVSVTLGVTVDPSAAAGSPPRGLLVNVAEVLANEPEPPLQAAKANNRTELETELVARANLRLELEAPSSVIAGRFVVHRLRVLNRGPSDSPGGTVEVEAEVVPDATSPDANPRLELVGSPEGCFANGGSSPLFVECPLGPIPDGESVELCFGMRIASSATGTLETTATVLGDVKDPRSRNDQAFLAKTIEIEADLDLEQRGEPDPVPAGEMITYDIEVINRGPSDATGVVVCDYLPQEVVLLDPMPEPCPGPSPCCPPPDEAAGQVVEAAIGTLPAGPDGATVAIQVEAPSTGGAIRSVARVVAGDPESDPEKRNDESTRATTVVEPGDLDLALTLVGPADPVIAGGRFKYMLTVSHRGPSGDSLAGVQVEAELPDGVDLLEIQGAECGDCMEATDGSCVVVCTMDTLTVGAQLELQLVVKSMRPPGSTFEVTSRLAAPDPDDPDQTNDSARAVTRVLGDLALPYFESGVPPSGPTTLLAVRNNDEDPAPDGVSFEVRSTRGVAAPPERCELSGRAVLTARLPAFRTTAAAVCADPMGSPLEAGSLEVRRLGAEPEPETSALLSGDAFRVAGSLASGNRLVRTAPSASPPELCKRWATRFLNGGPFDGGSEFVFWLPRGARAATEITRIQGKVYDEMGQVVQTVVIETGEEAFVRSSLEVFDLVSEASGPQAGFIEVPFGAIEWSLPRPGHVSVVHRAEGRFAVGVPGVCLDPPEPSPGGDPQPVRRDTLVLPYFEVDLDSEGRTTLFALRNEGEKRVELSVEYFDRQGGIAFGGMASEMVGLEPKKIQTFNLRDPARASGLLVSKADEPDISGFVRIQPAAGFDGEVVLSGDYFRVDPQAGRAAGEALVKAGPEGSSTQLCRGWVTRLIAGGDFGGTTELVFYAPSSTGAGGSSLEGNVYDESGEFERAILLPAGEVAFDLEVGPDIDELGIDPPVFFGSIEWDLLDGPGHVSTLFRTSGGYSVLIPGVCLDP
jgi:uncharacterized repeat protein (TIGR01451 family)